MAPQKPREGGRSVGVEQNLHATAVGCSKELLAKARTSCACSRLTDGNHSKNSSIVEPWSRCSNSVATGSRVPRKHHFPPSFAGFRSTALHDAQSMFLVCHYRQHRSNLKTKFRMRHAQRALHLFARRPARENESEVAAPLRQRQQLLPLFRRDDRLFDSWNGRRRFHSLDALINAFARNGNHHHARRSGRKRKRPDIFARRMA